MRNSNDKSPKIDVKSLESYGHPDLDEDCPYVKILIVEDDRTTWIILRDWIEAIFHSLDNECECEFFPSEPFDSTSDIGNIVIEEILTRKRTEDSGFHLAIVDQNLGKTTKSSMDIIKALRDNYLCNGLISVSGFRHDQNTPVQGEDLQLAKTSGGLKALISQKNLFWEPRIVEFDKPEDSNELQGSLTKFGETILLKEQEHGRKRITDLISSLVQLELRFSEITIKLPNSDEISFDNTAIQGGTNTYLFLEALARKGFVSKNQLKNLYGYRHNEEEKPSNIYDIEVHRPLKASLERSLPEIAKQKWVKITELVVLGRAVSGWKLNPLVEVIDLRISLALRDVIRKLEKLSLANQDRMAEYINQELSRRSQEE